MKTKNIFYLISAVMMFIFVSCEPIENREILKNSFDPDKIELKVVQATKGGNKLSLQMNTPGVTGYWDFIIGKKFSDRVDVIFPIPGKQTFTYYVSTAYIKGSDIRNVEYIKKTIDVQIDVLDAPLPEAYVKLVGSNFTTGKTWEFDRSDPGKWWYMTDVDWKAFWWQPDTNSDVEGRMTFDLNGAANFTSYKSSTAPAIKGQWVFNSDYTKLTITGDANILGVEDGGVNNKGSKTYDIIELTDSRMVLFQLDMAWSPGWVWVFKPVN